MNEKPLQDEVEAARAAVEKLERKSRSTPRGPVPRAADARKAARRRAKASRKRNR